jgi:hypothetical protein
MELFSKFQPFVHSTGHVLRNGAKTNQSRKRRHMLVPCGSQWLRLAMIDGVLAGQLTAMQNGREDGETAALVDLGTLNACYRVPLVRPESSLNAPESDQLRLQLLTAASCFSTLDSDDTTVIVYRSIPISATAPICVTFGTVCEQTDLMFNVLGAFDVSSDEIILGMSHPF